MMLTDVKRYGYFFFIMFDGSKIISIFASTKRNMLCFDVSGETDGLVEIQENDYMN